MTFVLLNMILKGRFVHLCIAIKNIVFDIVSVYTPSGNGTECINFYTSAREYV